MSVWNNTTTHSNMNEISKPYSWHKKSDTKQHIIYDSAQSSKTDVRNQDST